MATKLDSDDGSNANEVSTGLIENRIREIVQRITGSTNVEYSIEPASKKGDGFMGEIFRILFKNTNDPKTNSLILKIAPRDSNRRKLTKARELFLLEIFMYDEVLSYFNDFQLSKGINVEKNGFNECAKCFSSMDDNMSEALFLEDLKLRHFEMINLREMPLTFEHTALLMKALGKFHAISFALKEQQPAKFKQLSDFVFERYWTMIESKFVEHYKDMIDRFAKCLEREKRFDLLEKFMKIAGENPCESVKSFISGTLAEPYSVICHGDLTTNNCMYRTTEQGTPVEIQLFDWQFCRFASPVTELVLFLLCSSTKELRDKHYDEFLRIYHESLSDLLIRLGSDPLKIFPFEALLNQFRKFMAYAAFVGTVLIPMLCAGVDSMPDLNEYADKGRFSDDIYRFSDEAAYCQRVTDMFHDMARFEYL